MKTGTTMAILGGGLIDGLHMANIMGAGKCSCKNKLQKEINKSKSRKKAKQVRKTKQANRK